MLNPSGTQHCDTQGICHIQIFHTAEVLLTFEALPVSINSYIQILGNLLGDHI